MESKLIELATGKLLSKFGAGNHKPGSGSAAALQGLLSAQLLLTVIELTKEKKREATYKQRYPELDRINFEIRSRIYPLLEQWFQKDSEEFDKVIKLRDLRDKEQNHEKKAILKQKSQDALKPATEIPIEIAKLCIELSNFAKFIFDNGFKSARGDSGVALNNSISAVAGCLSIINLNLASFGNNDWTEKIRLEVRALTSDHRDLLTASAERLQLLEKDANVSRSFNDEIAVFRSDLWIDSKLSNTDIEEIARRLQLTLWMYRDKFWEDEKPEDAIELLNPEIVLTKILGYNFIRTQSLGQHEINGDRYEIAGLINKKLKSVGISTQFPEHTQNFTAAHELGHALLHRQNILHRDKPMDGSGSRNPRDTTELQADKFAAYFLMPKKQIENIFRQLFLMEKFVINEDNVFGLTGGELKMSAFRYRHKDLRGLARTIASAEFFRNQAFNSMAKVFNVSVETKAIRLEELGLVEF